MKNIYKCSLPVELNNDNVIKASFFQNLGIKIETLKKYIYFEKVGDNYELIYQSDNIDHFNAWDAMEISYFALSKVMGTFGKNKEVKIEFDILDSQIKPSHYKTDSIDVIDICKILELNFNRGNVLKYISRAGKKQNELEDLNKALEYLKREISYIETKNK